MGEELAQGSLIIGDDRQLGLDLVDAVCALAVRVRLVRRFDDLGRRRSLKRGERNVELDLMIGIATDDAAQPRLTLTVPRAGPADRVDDRDVRVVAADDDGGETDAPA